MVSGPAVWAFTIVAVSCLFGLGISFFGFSTRRLVSATGFTVMGCTNKLLTLLVNSLVWSQHATYMGQARSHCSRRPPIGCLLSPCVQPLRRAARRRCWFFATVA